MKDENKKIDAFFSARLQNETVGEDEWNIPSDEIWNAAKPKFIDRKRPRRRFVFWLLIPLLAFCIGVPLKYLEGEEVSNSDLQTEQSVEDSKNENIYNAEPLMIAQNVIQENTKTPSTEIQKNDKNTSQPSIINEPLKKTKTRSTSKKILDKNNNLGQTNQTKGIKEFSQEQSIDEAEIKEEVKVKVEREANKVENTRQKLVIPYLNTINTGTNLDLKLSSISDIKLVEYSKGINLIDPKFIIPAANPIFRNEIGISHSELLLNLFLAFEVQSDNPNDQITISNKYFNANVTGRKWLNRRWSILTGLQYSKLDLGVNFSVIDTLDKELMQFINEEFNDISSRSTIGDQDTDVTIDLKDGIDTQLGDLLNIQGDVRLQVRAIQIPFFLDYHIYKKKFEYIFGLGVTLDFMKVSELATNIEIYKSNQLISKPVNIPEFKESYVDGSIYIKSGMRYLISDRFHFGLDAKINLLGLPFSGLDAGFYYRWN